MQKSAKVHLSPSSPVGVVTVRKKTRKRDRLQGFHKKNQEAGPLTQKSAMPVAPESSVCPETASARSYGRQAKGQWQQIE